MSAKDKAYAELASKLDVLGEHTTKLTGQVQQAAAMNAKVVETAQILGPLLSALGESSDTTTVGGERAAEDGGAQWN